MRTLVIASAASATAALVTSRLWIAGTWIAAALTPVLVTLVSEMLRRPTERIARGITADRPALPDPDAPAPRPEAAAAERVAERLRDVDELLPDPEAPPARAGAPPAPTHVYRSESVRGAPRRRKIAYRVVLATAGIAFLIGAVTLTLGELVGGGSVGNNSRRTTLIGGSGKKKLHRREPSARADHPGADRDRAAADRPPKSSQPRPRPRRRPHPRPLQQPPGEPQSTETTPTTPAQPVGTRAPPGARIGGMRRLPWLLSLVLLALLPAPGAGRRRPARHRQGGRARWRRRVRAAPFVSARSPTGDGTAVTKTSVRGGRREARDCAPGPLGCSDRDRRPGPRGAFRPTARRSS